MWPCEATSVAEMLNQLLIGAVHIKEIKRIVLLLSWKLDKDAFVMIPCYLLLIFGIL